VYAYVPSEIAQQFESKANADKLAAAMPNVETAVDPLLQHRRRRSPTWSGRRRTTTTSGSTTSGTRIPWR
jgi:hypothetical protein